MAIEDVLSGSQPWHVDAADALEWLASLPERSVDLVLFSPPYASQRSYGIGFKLEGEEWVAWMVQVMQACLRVCKGLVACVCEGPTKNYRWTALPALLSADLHRAGVHLRKTVVYHRSGICGSGGNIKQHEAQGGGTDWLRNDWEHIVCATNGGKLPWAHAEATGSPCKYGVGGELSYRTPDGTRINASKARKVVDATTFGLRPGEKFHTKRTKGATLVQVYTPPEIANPGNVIKCVVGGGRIGDDLAHENEAPFPESLVEFFVRSFCPPNGITLDCMCGSGTTGAVAIRHGRRFLGCDLRESQRDLSTRRISRAAQQPAPAAVRPKREKKPLAEASEQSLFDNMEY